MKILLQEFEAIELLDKLEDAIINAQQDGGAYFEFELPDKQKLEIAINGAG